MSSKYDGSRGAATHLLKHYFRLVAERAGVQWDSDNDTEVEAIVDGILTAARQEFSRDSLYDYIGDVAHKQLVFDLQHDASVQSLAAGAVEAVAGRRGRMAYEAQQEWLDAQAAQAGTQEDGAAYGDGDLQCSACLSHITSTYAVAYGDGYLCPACASEALAAVPVSAIAYLMADIAPTDTADAQKLHESRAAVTAWLESLEAEED